MIDWRDSFGDGDFRCVIYPIYLNTEPKFPDYNHSNIKNNVVVRWDGMRACYGAQRLIFPPETNAAIIDVSGNVRFTAINKSLLNYGHEERAKFLFFSGQKRFPASPNAIKFGPFMKLEKIGAWGILEEERGG